MPFLEKYQFRAIISLINRDYGFAAFGGTPNPYGHKQTGPLPTFDQQYDDLIEGEELPRPPEEQDVCKLHEFVAATIFSVLTILTL